VSATYSRTQETTDIIHKSQAKTTVAVFFTSTVILAANIKRNYDGFSSHFALWRFEKKRHV
jgi:hypothetical protein